LELSWRESNHMVKIMKKIPIIGMLLIICVMLLCVLVFLIQFRINAKAQGESIGTNVGLAVGKAIGSIDGLSDAKLAYSEGKRAGINAEDTAATVVNKIKEVGKLEVFIASVKLNNIHTIADDYSALYLLKGDVVFTVDLSKAEINERDGALYITLEQPSVELIVNASSVRKVAEWQRYFFSGTSEDGFDAYLNTMTEITQATEDNIENYESLMVSAKGSAKNQITQLANLVTVTKREVFIDYEVKKNE